MAPKGQAAKAAAAEEAALTKAAANPALKRSWTQWKLDAAKAETAATQVDHVVDDTQDDKPLTLLDGVASGPLQTPAMNADDTSGEDWQAPEQQSPQQQACRPLSPPHHTNLQI